MPGGLGALDADGDGKISQSEWLAADVDGDGKVDAWDLRKMGLQSALAEVRATKEAISKQGVMNHRFAVIMVRAPQCARHAIPHAPHHHATTPSAVQEAERARKLAAKKAEAEARKAAKSAPREPLEQKSEYEQLLATLPRTSGQAVGFHKIPEIDVARHARTKRAPPKLDTGYADERADAIASAQAAARRLDARGAAADPELSGALRTLRARVQKLDLSRNSRCQERNWAL